MYILMQIVVFPNNIGSFVTPQLYLFDVVYKVAFYMLLTNTVLWLYMNVGVFRLVSL